MPTLETAETLGVRADIISGGGHLNAESGYTEFPRVLEILKEMLHD
jgi:predicted alpha/beta hydrolase family esterase